MEKIKSVKAREILDSRGNPTVEVEITLDSGIKARSDVPSGVSTGTYEALELRDNDRQRYKGKGVLKATANVHNIIAPKITGMEINENLDAPGKFDEMMLNLDGTENKSKLGANAILGVSMAIAKVSAMSLNLPLYKYFNRDSKILPVPMMNILNGGTHANWQSTDFQEFMIVPWGAKNFAESLRYGAEIYHELKGLLKAKNFSTSVGDEGGFVVNVKSNEEPINLIIKAIENAGYEYYKDVGIGLDVAASGFYKDKDGKYELTRENLRLTSDEMIEKYEYLIKGYKILSVEDGLAEDDWEGWQKMNKKIGNKVTLIGDDLFVTNIERLERGIKEKSANAVLIKLNQIGTVSETMSAVNLAHKTNWKTIISHRSGETADTFIADFCVGMNIKLIKTGAPCRSERVEKYNQLIRIEEELGNKREFAGKEAFK
ncbi:MAG: phosphopyruvate hydratase [Candidatus Altiarchaeum hamiconexum]|uniref:Enolase n=1 Tax=Candidatus Altarchaeum hamiconexum TaxID=1803513 RepID=A0A8J8CGI4_9ARCH|nr:phosphopyruvate hydratase [Candidatus Altarchaeum hamiconexum]OIQ06401.1 MAG: phosphopyruvate hydratase [Candidatus Altarchaeum sp. CG2_30_32_3053]PIN67270.1 MAG: phosphopyruvate hydratase [Candidatus Altarchaeum sp. CG12_big_fil_rev_8_21_14_0_65_33_22]PIV27108.1 MAG: phosphopyruvate hydratase [Candidatus Altarchaeum sp. CG03_land_8_20_14_0_80_32_618]NCN69457.1 phosphopyruvate hydratase [Candidatus Altarchaeum hamiconexum]